MLGFAVRAEEHRQGDLRHPRCRKRWQRSLLILSLFGWASVRTGWALRGAILLAGYGAMLALFARADTFYWALIAAPLSFAGLAFLPKVIADLAKAVRRTPYRAA